MRAIREAFNVSIGFPVIEDPSMAVGRAFGMIDETSQDSAAIRSTYFIDPDGVIRAITTYPHNVGRSVDEMLRMVAALQCAAGDTVLTPEGRVSKYLFGIEFAPRDVQLALVEASDRKIGTVVDDVLLFCYHYDPETGTYGFAIMNMVRAGGILTVLALAASILMTLRRERRQIRVDVLLRGHVDRLNRVRDVEGVEIDHRRPKRLLGDA